jgi:hypothetical protein
MQVVQDNIKLKLKLKLNSPENLIFDPELY